MNLLRKAPSPMRIIALPLVRVRVPREVSRPNVNASTMLVFYQFDLIRPCDDREDPSWYKKMLKSATSKAVGIWTSLGKAPKGSWKLWTHELGERMADRIDFEELALRNLDPVLGPPVPLTGSNNQLNVDKNMNQSHSLQRIPLVYPPSLYPTCGTGHALHPAVAHLQTLLANRGPRHRRGFYLWMFIAPLTVPITLIPIIPNLPLFFCIWRSWSHYRAYKSSQYLASLLDHELIEATPSLDLDYLYASFNSSSRTSPHLPESALEQRSSEKMSTSESDTVDRKSETASGPSLSSCLLLTPEAIPRVLDMFRLPESAAVNLHRAIHQACGRRE